MKDTLASIVSSLVDNPKSVAVVEEETNGFVQLTLTVAKEDMGKIIGKEGKVIRSIRNIMKIKALKHNKKIAIALQENE